MTTKRIGIFSGVFDPVHAGHIGFALAAIKQAKLDKVYLMVEARPRHKTGVTHLAHRLAMVKLATAHHPKLAVLELPDRQFSVANTLPRLRQHFPDDKLLLLTGSDSLELMPKWPLVSSLFSQAGLIIARRRSTSQQAIKKLVHGLPTVPNDLYIILSPAPEVSSGRIRQEIKQSGKATSALPSLRTYITDNWLYVTPSGSSSSSSS